MKTAIVIFVYTVLLATSIAMTVVHLMHKSSVDGYIQGCKDTASDLLHGTGITGVDQDSLDKFCVNKSRKYVKK